MNGKIFGSCFVLLAALASSLRADAYVCPDGSITVQGASDEREPEICAAAELATRQLASCNLEVPDGVTIEVTQSVPGECYGVYHCHEELIQLLPLEAYESYLAANAETPFGHLPPRVFFDSVLRHELAHAALEDMPCPFGDCRASQEFVAYTMQIMFLPETDRAAFDARVHMAERPVPRERLNTMILMMAPDVFIEHAYTYLSQQDDPCILIGKIARGEVILDTPLD
jgi:hypothetical protein